MLAMQKVNDVLEAFIYGLASKFDQRLASLKEVSRKDAKTQRRRVISCRS